MKKTHNFSDLEGWVNPAGSHLVISGPCSLESEVQIHSTVSALSQCGIDIVRAGIWKPRTRPGHFEGVGAKGLKWLKSAGKQFGLPVACEVATAGHVEACLKEEIDVLWIGARTTVSPFSVQILADALQGVDIPVLVKNPMCAELELWIGSMERLYRSGIRKLAAVHRGFSFPQEKTYRYPPLWHIPLELKKKIPKLPIICDPSHICGRADRIESVARRALSLGFHGLMLESHIDPPSALSDARQQLTPQQVKTLLKSIMPSRKNPAHPSPVLSVHGHCRFSPVESKIL